MRTLVITPDSNLAHCSVPEVMMLDDHVATESTTRFGFCKKGHFERMYRGKGQLLEEDQIPCR